MANNDCHNCFTNEAAAYCNAKRQENRHGFCRPCIDAKFAEDRRQGKAQHICEPVGAECSAIIKLRKYDAKLAYLHEVKDQRTIASAEAQKASMHCVFCADSSCSNYKLLTRQQLSDALQDNRFMKCERLSDWSHKEVVYTCYSCGSMALKRKGDLRCVNDNCAWDGHWLQRKERRRLQQLHATDPVKFASRCTIKLKQRCLVQLQEKMRKASLVTCRRSSCPNNTPLVKEDMKGEPKGEHDLTDGLGCNDAKCTTCGSEWCFVCHCYTGLDTKLAKREPSEWEGQLYDRHVDCIMCDDMSRSHEIVRFGKTTKTFEPAENIRQMQALLVRLVVGPTLGISHWEDVRIEDHAGCDMDRARKLCKAYAHLAKYLFDTNGDPIVYDPDKPADLSSANRLRFYSDVRTSEASRQRRDDRLATDFSRLGLRHVSDRWTPVNAIVPPMPAVQYAHPAPGNYHVEYSQQNRAYFPLAQQYALPPARYSDEDRRRGAQGFPYQPGQFPVPMPPAAPRMPYAPHSYQQSPAAYARPNIPAGVPDNARYGILSTDGNGHIVWTNPEGQEWHRNFQGYIIPQHYPRY